MTGENKNIKKESEPQRPAYAVIRFEDKFVSASIEVVAPKGGGADITLEMLRAALLDAGVCYGINEEVLTEIAENKIYDDEFTVADFTPPKNGKDGSIIYEFSTFNTAFPSENERGFVDYRELGLIRSITAGTVIATITLPVDGVPGKDVLGREIAPVPPKKAKFAVGSGTVLSPDGLTITAAFDGHLVFEKNAFVVKRILDIKCDIDFNTGNIEYLGDINIRGNVGEGFKVVSTGGNVTIQGGVFSGALIKASGNITVNQVANHCILEAGGDIKAAFCEYCNISADGNITASTLMICEVYSGGVLATKGSNRGGIVGGQVTALRGMNISNNIGSPNYPITVIFLGDNAILGAEREKLSTKIEKYKNEITDLTMIIDYLNNKRKSDKFLTHEREVLLGESVKNRIMRMRDIKKTTERIDEIDNLLQNSQNLKLEVTGTIYPKTKININTVRFETTEEWKHVSVFVDKDNEVHYSPM